MYKLPMSAQFIDRIANLERFKHLTVLIIKKNAFYRHPDYICKSYYIHFSYDYCWVFGSFLTFSYVSLQCDLFTSCFDVFVPYDSYACIRFIRLFTACTFSPVIALWHYPLIFLYALITNNQYSSPQNIIVCYLGYSLYSQGTFIQLSMCKQYFFFCQEIFVKTLEK